MAEGFEPEPGAGHGIAGHGIVFNLDRFEPAGGDRLELSGRWFGVRGRRFIRPTLTLLCGGERHRCLADLADKPWAAQDGEPWRATFPCDAELVQALDEAQFSVAPDITIALPAPGHAFGETAPTQVERDAPERVDRKRAPTVSPRPDQRSGTGERMLRTSEEAVVRRELAIATRALERERAENGRLQRELERSEVERADTASRLDEAQGHLIAAVTDRDHAQQARDQAAAEGDQAHDARDLAIAERDAALRSHDQSAAERDAARRGRDEALQERERALKARERAASELDEALEAPDRATAERDAAIEECERTVAQLSEERMSRDRVISEALAARDQALDARDQALAERDALAGTIEKLESDRAEAISARGAALVMRNSMQAGPAARGNPPRVWLWTAILVVLACLLALALATHVF